MERLIEWTSAFDRRHPDAAKNYGIHGMELKFVLKGPEGAVQFQIFTNWHLKHVRKEMDDFSEDKRYQHMSCHPVGADLGYHSLRSRYEDQSPITDACPYLDGRPCYYDGSSLQAEELLWKFIAQGEAVVWSTLEDRYTTWLVDTAVKS